MAKGCREVLLVIWEVYRGNIAISAVLVVKPLTRRQNIRVKMKDNEEKVPGRM
jgi:hypothetical protein